MTETAAPDHYYIAAFVTGPGETEFAPLKPGQVEEARDLGHHVVALVDDPWLSPGAFETVWDEVGEDIVQPYYAGVTA